MEWEGKKHPDTPQKIQDHVAARDRIRRVLMSRCRVCYTVVSRDEKEVKELVFECDDPNCYCKKTPYQTKIHQVCDGCYSLWQALYFNKGLKDAEYYKKLDLDDKKAAEDFKKRWKKE